MQIDKQKTNKIAQEIQQALVEIRQIASLPDDDFWANKEHLAALKYYLLQAIEGTGSICLHILARKYNKGVSVFGECFEKLAEEGFLDRGLSQDLKQMVHFRNMLIHRYWEIDDKKVLRYARENLKDIKRFLVEVGKL